MTTSKALLKALDARDGHVCALCGLEDDTLVPHHRANRGMGGRRSLDRMSNLVWLCSMDNGLVESDAFRAVLARERGVKVSSHVEPANVPVRHAVHGLVFLLDKEPWVDPHVEVEW